MFDLNELERAHKIVGTAVPATPAHAWPLLAERLGTEVVVKHENHTPTGAFKVRGGLVYLERLKRERPDVPGIISATRGNHGQSLAFAAGRHGVPAVIYVPRGNSVEKNRAMHAFGAELVEHGDDFQAAREEAERRAQFAGLHMVPSFHRTWCWALRPTRSNCSAPRPISTFSTCRSGRAPASRAASWRATCSG